MLFWLMSGVEIMSGDLETGACPRPISADRALTGLLSGSSLMAEMIGNLGR
jgi:hypothetical protein